MTIREQTEAAHNKAVDRMMARFRAMSASNCDAVIEAIAATFSRDDIDKDMVALALIGAFAVNGIVRRSS